MGVRRWLATRAVAGVRVLVVESPGWWTVRAGVERELRERGWSLALSPADADALVVVGVPGDQLRDVVERVWDQLPGPRARCEVVRGPVGEALDALAGVLLDDDHHRADAASRDASPVADGDGGGTDMGDGGGMDMGDMDMDMAPDGIDLAGGFDDDRDGLEMDVLHVPLGPVLEHWPAGLVLRCTLSGDVAVEVGVEVLDADGQPPEGALPAAASPAALTAAQRCDRAARLLSLAGSDLAVGLQRVRDDLLAGASSTEVAPALDALTRRVTRSRVLRWSLRDLGRLDDSAAARLGLPTRCRGDVHDRLLAVLDEAVAALAGNGGGERATFDVPDPERVVAAARAALPALVTGYELAALRLVVASLPLDHGPALERGPRAGDTPGGAAAGPRSTASSPASSRGAP